MSLPSNRGGPGIGEMLRMTLFNAVAAFLLLKVVFFLFGNRDIFAEAWPQWAAEVVPRWDKALLMTPGAAIGFTGLWRWLIVNRRGDELPWGGALVYGAIIAYCNVPVAGFVAGLLMGDPLIGLLLALASLILLPSLLLSMTVFGLTMGLLNGSKAQRWIDGKKG